jgi:hypothetical protein
MATSTAELRPHLLAEMFCEVEKDDMRVVEVRVREIPTSWHDDMVDRDGKTLWNAKLTCDRRMPKGKVVLRCESAEECKPVRKARTRTFLTNRVDALVERRAKEAEAARERFLRGDSSGK